MNRTAQPYGRAKGKCRVCGGYFTGDHPQVGLTDEYGLHAHVDKQIASLVAACWAAGIPTTASCQGSDTESAYVSFPSGFAERFAHAATLADHPDVMEEAPEGSLDARIYEFRDFADSGGWRWMPGYPWDPGFAVYFPSADISELTRRLESRRFFEERS